MQDIIKVKSASYKRYEELLQEKEELLKEAENYRVQYEQFFDALSKEVNIARMDCVKKRKIISYCKSKLSSCEDIVRVQLDEFVEKAMKDYQETLDFLNDSGNEQEPKKEILADEGKNLKSLYRSLAKLVHPDMNPDIQDDEVIQDLWNRANIAYNCQDEEELEELNVLVNRYLEKTNRRFIEYEIPDINEKIFNLNRKIYRITHTNPYQYRLILEDEETREKKKEELNKELSDYRRYGEELDREISTLETFIKNE